MSDFANTSNRATREARAFARALEVIEDEESARTWLSQANRALGGATPLSLMNSDEGLDLVLTILARIEYGIYS